MSPAGERLNRYLARRGIASRRAADTLIAEGRVSVNGRPGSIGSVVDTTRDEVAVDGVHVDPAPASVTFALHKPAGVVTTRSDPQGRPTVMSLVDSVAGLVPVGRLDADSRGLLLLTTDGDLAHRATHPRFGLRKRYRLTLSEAVPDSAVEQLRAGVQLDDGPARALEVRRGRKRNELMVVMGEGRKREVRRMCAAAGLIVTDLLREAVGPVELEGLVEGAARPLTPAEDRALRHALRLAKAPIITVDGPAGSGKTTLGRGLAMRLGLRLLDTGLLYRAVSVAATRAGIAADDAGSLSGLAAALRIHVETDPSAVGAGVTVDGERLGEEALHDPALAPFLARVSATPGVRRALLEPQRRLAGDGAVAVGRDCGTVVFPEAEVKLFLEAAAPVRARRRERQLARAGGDVSAAVLEREISGRDRMDEERAEAPLRRASDAHVIDTERQGIEEVLEQALALCAAAGLVP